MIGATTSAGFVLAVDGTDILLFFAFVGLGAILIGAHRAIHRAAEADKRRNKRLAALARKLDCEFTPGAVHANLSQFKPFTVFAQQGAPYVANTFRKSMRTRRGRTRVVMGDFRMVTRIQTRRGQVEQIREFSYMLIDLPFNTQGRLLVRREGQLDAIAERFGAEDIDFESAAFNRQFLVRASSKRYAFDVLHPAMLELVMDTEPMPLLIDHRRCCIADTHSRWTAKLFEAKLNWLERFIDAFGAHVASGQRKER